MTKKVYSGIYLHIVWRTKDNIPMIGNEIETALYKYIKHRCASTHGVYCHAIGGTRDHIHLCVSVPPNLLISDWVGELKGAGSHYINHNVRPKSLQWQAGYGVVSFGRNNLEFVKKYIEKQKEHHSTGKIHDRLEMAEKQEPLGDS